jgi:hypothetical protein
MALMASSDPGEIRWYSEPDGGNIIANGEVFFPPELSETITYYVDATFNNCVTPERTEVTAVVKNVPEITGVSDGVRCGEGEVLLGADVDAGIILWYADSTSTEALAEGLSFTTPQLTNSAVYFVGAVSEGCASSARFPVTATVSYNDTCSVNTAAPIFKQRLHAFPDPTTGKFEILLEGISDYPEMMSIFNASGILMRQTGLTKNKHNVQADLSGLPGGLYFIILQGDSAIYSLKILKQ